MSTDDLEHRLRAVLATEAGRAPSDTAVADRILARTVAATPRSRRPWSDFLLPLVAACAVLLVAATVVWTLPARTSPPGTITGSGTTGRGTASPSAPAPGGGVPTPNTPSPAPPTVTPAPAAFHASDLSFLTATDGWALGTAQCFADPTRRCTSLIRTTDGGKHWVSAVNPPATVTPAGGLGVDLTNTDPSCPDAPCVRRVRFVTDRIGYAWGNSALFGTTDGAATWHRVTMPFSTLWDLAVAGNRVLAVGSGCAQSSCPVVVVTGPVGAASLGTSVGSGSSGPPGATVGTVAGADLTVAGDSGYLLLQGGPGSLWRIGSGFTRLTPCGTDTVADAAGASDGSITVGCTQAGGPTYLATATNGATFTPGASLPGGPPVVLVGAASARIGFLMADVFYRAGAGGFQIVHHSGAGPGSASQLSFLDAKRGFVVEAGAADGASTLWSTGDGGVTWTSLSFS